MERKRNIFHKKEIFNLFIYFLSKLQYLEILFTFFDTYLTTQPRRI